MDVQEELEEIKEMVEERKHNGDVSFWTLLTEQKYVKPLVIMLVLMLLQQLSGISYILGYSTIIMKVSLQKTCIVVNKILIFQSAGTSLGECRSTMLLGCVQVIGSVATTVCIERFGRRVLLIMSEIFICLSMIGVAVFFLLKENFEECHNGSNNGTEITTFWATTTEYSATSTSIPTSTTSILENIGFLPLASLMVFLAAFFMGLGPIPFILNVELFPLEARVRPNCTVLVVSVSQIM